MPPNNPRFLNILRPKIRPRLDLTDFSATQETKLLGEICKSSECFSIMVSRVQILVILWQGTKFRMKSQRFFTNFHTQKVTDSFIFKKFQKTDKKEQLFLLLIFGGAKLYFQGKFWFGKLWNVWKSVVILVVIGIQISQLILWVWLCVKVDF